MKARSARPYHWTTALAIVFFALCSFAGASGPPSCSVGVQGTPAPEDTLVLGPVMPDESPLPPPLWEELSSSTVHTPPLSTDENSVPALAVFRDDLSAGRQDQQALKAAGEQQGTQIVGLLTAQLQQGQELSQLGNDVAMLMTDQLHLTNTIAAIENDAAKRQAHPSFVQTVALASGGIFALAILGIVIIRVVGSRSPSPLPSSTNLCHKTKSVGPVEPGEESGLPDIHMALTYLSTPKHEDRIACASCPGLHVLALADGASSCRGEGTEFSGGGGAAAALAVKVAITHLTERLSPALSITELLGCLNDCFAKARTALVHHNNHACIPSATTLLMAALWQAESGVWFWLYGNIGDGYLTLLHTGQLLSGWPLHTPLLSKQSNGTTTITLPGYAAAGVTPSMGIRPHVPGDMLLIGSDGLDHLDTVTKHADRLTLANYLWTRIRGDRPHLSTLLQALPQERTDAPWQNALTLDDTTLGILWS